MKEQKRKYKDYLVDLTSLEDIDQVVRLTKSESEIMLVVQENELQQRVENGLSLVAKYLGKEVVGHEAAHVWENKWIEIRSAVVNKEHRGKGLNSFMTDIMLGILTNDFPDSPVFAFTEEGSMMKGILVRKNFRLVNLDKVPKEFTDICPDKCVFKTGNPCGCEVYLQY